MCLFKYVLILYFYFSIVYEYIISGWLNPVHPINKFLRLHSLIHYHHLSSLPMNYCATLLFTCPLSHLFLGLV